MTVEFEDYIEQAQERVRKFANALTTEEATKTALIMPFIKNILGYDTTNPLEVIPEFTADEGIKKGEKVDFAIKNNDETRILIECKRSGDILNRKYASQLYRYFSVTNARIAILTNGVQYQFYTDLDEPNRMDESPYMEIDLINFNWRLVDELKKLNKHNFDLEHILSAAEELKYTNRIKRLLASEFADPSDEFVKLLVKRVYHGKFTQSVREGFRETVKKAAGRFLNDSLNDRLKGAMREDYVKPENTPAADLPDDSNSETGPTIETTVDELQGLYIVKAILAEDIDIDRIADRDTLSYYGILLDNNNRKPICRLHFNRAQKYIGTFDENKRETRHPIDSVSDIYKYKKEIRKTINFYD